jgi:hypothetical protein
MAHSYGAKGKVEGNVFERACEGKQRYDTEAGAQAGLRYLQRERVLRTGDGMAVYQCTFCQGWHFGH